MTARSVPTLPSIAAGLKSRASYLSQIEAYLQFWANVPMFSMYQTAVQTLTTGNDTKITMDSITAGYDSDSGRAGVTPWSYTIPSGMGGRWRFAVAIAYASNSTGARAAQIRVNGVTPTAKAYNMIPAVNGNITVVQVARTLTVAAGDVISAYGYQSSGGNLATYFDANIGSSFEGELRSLANP